MCFSSFIPASASQLQTELISGDETHRVTDEEAVAMSRYLALHDGFFLGSSAAVNLVACVRVALSEKFGKGSGKVIVTILWLDFFFASFSPCVLTLISFMLTRFSDSGTRHLSKFW